QHIGIQSNSPSKLCSVSNTNKDIIFSPSMQKKISAYPPNVGPKVMPLMMDMGWQLMPELGGRVRDSSALHGAEADRRNREANGGGRTEGAGGHVNTEEFGQVRWSKVMDVLECNEE
ncbi:hypothetical protein CHARACLAT_017005, partial [Characodon lateralis]|nr:hypothetical protein [Characodon lateralis]